MAKEYVGQLSRRDPLYHYLQHEIAPQLDSVSPHADYRVYKMKGTHDVYLYVDMHSANRVVGKFFGAPYEPNAELAARRAAREFDNLRHLRSYGLAGQPHHVERPLGLNPALNSLLVVEYCTGDSLSRVINTAIHEGNHGRLYRKLAALAYFLATQHNRSANGVTVDFHQDCHYFDQLVTTLLDKGTIDRNDVSEFHWLRERWREQPRMWADRQVLVHGDATPSNFVFGKGCNVAALDLERMKRADRMFDVGRLAGELQHFFLNATADKYAAEPFIGHFLWEYACHFPDRERTFHAITARAPFYMGLTLLRIARNSWLDRGYRRRLAEEAKITLRAYS